MIKKLVRKIPGMQRFLLWRASHSFRGLDYWERRYGAGGTSGSGSYGTLAEFKAAVLNRFVQEQGVTSLIEFGCGDGNQLSLAEYPRYVGLDIARGAISLCKTRFAVDNTKSFFLYEPHCFVDNAQLFRCDAALSLDVLFHLVEDEALEQYLAHLFQSADRFVIIYSSNTDLAALAPQEKHRCFTQYVTETFPDWALVEKIVNPFPLSKYPPPFGSPADFYIYKHRSSGLATSGRHRESASQ